MSTKDLPALAKKMPMKKANLKSWPCVMPVAMAMLLFWEAFTPSAKRSSLTGRPPLLLPARETEYSNAASAAFFFYARERCHNFIMILKMNKATRIAVQMAIMAISSDPAFDPLLTVSEPSAEIASNFKGSYGVVLICASYVFDGPI